ncbi:MAG TPA: hypothetical protein VNM39_01300 [Verrucomicrobiae bacterium]|nr:hypothetical protein [Verrucomicrobiae bacterium]
MAKTVVLCAYNVANFPNGGGHLWVYMQHVFGMKRLGCDVYWLECFRRSGDAERDAAAIDSFFARLASMGMAGRVILRKVGGPDPAAPVEWLGLSEAEAGRVIDRADLMLNFHYAIEPELLARFRRTAMVDIDPGLFQFWLSRGQLKVPRHDLYFTTGETVGTPGALFPDCGLEWVRIPPAVCVEQWSCANGDRGDAMTTVSAWDSPDWVVDRPAGIRFDNSKRVAFLPFRDLPRLTPQPLELALFLDTAVDHEEGRMMAEHGWRIRRSVEVAGSPQAYRDYIRRSRGEFSCAKPSCMYFQNAWVSDRTLCYLASGRPVVVQDTGPSALLPNGEGMFRFSTPEEAAAALEAMNTDYARHCRAARELAESVFDSAKVAARILEVATG